MGRTFGFLLRLLLLLGLGGWTTLALLLSPLAEPELRPWLAAANAVLVLAAFVALFLRGVWRQVALGAVLLVFVAVQTSLSLLPARVDRAWQPDVARMPTATVEGDRLTVRNVRDFAWTGPDTAIERWDDRTYDLSTLDHLDLVASYWAGQDIAHLMLSFGFADGRQLAVSIEIRKEEGETYSALGGFFRNYDLLYIAADERDIIGVRARFRGEDVYVYRLRTPPARIRAILMAYVAEMNRLAVRPAWYNTLTTNCTTQILFNAAAAGTQVPWSWKILLPGHTPEYIRDLGGMASDLPFPELRERSRVTEAARAAGDAADFSIRIREQAPAG